MIDAVDQQILMIVQNNSRVSNVDIARQVGMAPSAVLERVRKLETRGVIQAYETRINPKEVGLGLLAFVSVRTNERAGALSTAHLLAEIPEVQEVHHVAGEDCFLCKVHAADTESLGRLLREQFGTIPTITSTRTTIVLHTIKETAQLPVTPEDEFTNVEPVTSVMEEANA